MSCPICGYKKTIMRTSEGFSHLIIEECGSCDCVYMIDKDITKILFKRDEHDKYSKNT
jgi:hypothetical protein